MWGDFNRPSDTRHEPMKASPKAVILGAGVGGLGVAGRLARGGGFDVAVVDGRERHLYQPALTEIPFHRKPLESFERSVDTLLPRGARWYPSDVRSIDPERRQVRLTSGRALDYDFLVIASGCHPSPRGIPGFYEGAYHFHCSKRALHLRGALAEFRSGDIVVGATRLPYKCPPSPHSFALLLDACLRRDGRRGGARLTFVYPLLQAYPVPALAGPLESLLRERGIAVETSFGVASIDAARRRVTAADGRSLPYDLLVLVPPHRGAPALSECGLAGEEGWVAADRFTLRVREGVYALGDAADLPVPKSGAAARAQAAVVAANIRAEAGGRPPEARYDGRVMCLFETGGRRAIRVDFSYERPPAPPVPRRRHWLLKRLVNRMYFRLIRA
jgi:sulfide:quinone oxidoreductase